MTLTSTVPKEVQVTKTKATTKVTTKATTKPGAKSPPMNHKPAAAKAKKPKQTKGKGGVSIGTQEIMDPHGLDEMNRAISENERLKAQAEKAMAEDKDKRIKAIFEKRGLDQEAPKIPRKNREATALQVEQAAALRAKKAKAQGRDDASDTVHSHSTGGGIRSIGDQRRLRSDGTGGGGDDEDDDEDDDDGDNRKGSGNPGGRRGAGGGGGGGGGPPYGSGSTGGDDSTVTIELLDLDPQGGIPTSWQELIIATGAGYGTALGVSTKVADSPRALAKLSPYAFSKALTSLERAKMDFPKGTSHALKVFLRPVISASLREALKGLRHWCIAEYSVGRNPDFALWDLMVAERYSIEAVRHEDPNTFTKIPTIPKYTSLEDYKLFEENLIAHVAAQTSASPSLAPLDYLMRTNEEPTVEQLADRSMPLPDFLRACQLIKMKEGTPEFIKHGLYLDQLKLYQIIRLATLNSLVAHFVLRYKDTKDGRQAFLDIREHSQGVESRKHIIMQAKKSLRGAHYDGKAGYTFPMYIKTFSEAHTALAEQGEPVYETAKVADFLDGIRAPALNTSVELVRKDKSLQENFLAVANILNSDVLRHKIENIQNRRNVGSTAQGGRGRGRGKGRGDRGGGRGGGRNAGRGKGRGDGGRGKPHPDEKKGELRHNADGTVFTGTYFWWAELGNKQKQVQDAREAKKKRSVSATRSDLEDSVEPLSKKTKVNEAQEATVVDVDLDLAIPMDVVAVAADDEIHPVKKVKKPLGTNAGTLMGKGARKSVTP